MNAIKSTHGEFHLPEELLGNHILSNIPAQHVFKYRALSKFYKELIEKDNFIQKNYDQSIKERPSIILAQRNSNGDGLYSVKDRRSDFLIDIDSTRSIATAHQLAKQYDGRDDDVIYDTFIDLMGSCRGILVYNHQNRFLGFWNPYNETYKISSDEDHPPLLRRNGHQKRCKYFLGYDALTDDLKVLVIIERKGFFDCFIYSLNSNSWRKTGPKLSYYVYIDMETSTGDNQVFVEGTNCVYALVHDNTSGLYCKSILQYNFASDEFNLIPIPEQFHYVRDWDEDRKLGILSLDGCLGLYYRYKSDCLEVWKMKESEVENTSWTRVFSLKPCGRSLDLVPITTMNYRLVMLSTNEESKIYLCDLKQEEELKEAIPIVLDKNESQEDLLLDLPNLEPQHFPFAASNRKP